MRKVTEYAQQIVSGLSAAHEKGIVHRDLKPENLFITKDDRVKIFDFGIAKLSEPRPVGVATGSEDATRKALTNPGVVMGTVGYMSPEQVRGQTTDHRSDIFSFGAILHEMITGRRAFQHETMAETMSAILKEEPKELTESNPNISPSLERIVRRCLEKKAERRFQSTSDLGFALESLSAPTSSSGRSMPEVATELEPARRMRGPLHYGLGMLLLVAGAVAGILSYSYMRRSPMPSYEQLTFRRGFVNHARFAPDGQTLVYSAAWNGNPLEIFSTRSGQNESRSLGLSDADVLAISSTGEMAVLLKRRFLGQMSYRGTLARMPMIGGTPREILEDVVEADWSPDGKDLAVVRYVDGRNRLEYPIGKVLYETAGYISYPRISPKGDRIAFMDHEIQWDNRGRVAVLDLAGNKTFISEEFSGEEGVAWSPAGNEVWFTAGTGSDSNNLHASTLSGQVRLVLRVPADLWLHDISRDGRVLLTRYKNTNDAIGLAPGETRERDLSWLDFGTFVDLSDDGKNFLFEYWGQGSGTNYAVYLGKTDGSPAVRLGEGGSGHLSPDGKLVVAIRSEPNEITFLPAGAGELRRLDKHRIERYNSVVWFPDGKQIVFTGREAGHADRSYIQAIDAGEPRPITTEGVTGTIVSPDGRYLIAYDSQGKAGIYPIEGDEKPRPIPALDDKDKIVRWSGDGHSLFVFPRGELPVKVSRLNLVTGRKELAKEISPYDRAGISQPPSIYLTPDGKGYVYRVSRYLMDLYLVDGLK